MKNSLLFLIAFLFSSISFAQPVLTFTQALTGLSSPVDIVSANDGTGRVFIVQRGGTVRVYNSSLTLLNSNFLTISTNIVSGGEQGLLSLAFHPDYENNRYFFVYYTNAASGINIDRFQTLSSNPNQADAATRTNIMTIPKPLIFGTLFSNHNGGKLNFGADGHLYFGLGDAGSGGDPENNSQNGNSYWGKMLRINVDNFTTAPFYTVPADNPFVGNAAVLDEIFSLGLRNPWRWSFDRQTGNLWISDVGQDQREEITMSTLSQARGGNYGWRCYEGTLAFNTTGCLPYSSYLPPSYEYPRNSMTGGLSVTGGYVYRGTVFPAMRGFHICADYISNNAFITNSTTMSTTIQAGLPAGISSFGERENGELLAVTLGGTLFNVSTSSVVPIRLISFSGYATSLSNNLFWQVANEIEVATFDIEASTDAVTFGKIATINQTNLSQYSYQHVIANKNLFYRIRFNNRDQTSTFSTVIKLSSVEADKRTVVNYNTGSLNRITLKINLSDLASFQLFNSVGQMVMSKSVYQANQVIDLSTLNKGVYLARVIVNGEQFGEKVMVY